MMSPATIVSSVRQYFIQTKVEMSKVSWLSLKTSTRYTIIVTVVSVASAIFLGGLDYGFSFIVTKIVP